MMTTKRHLAITLAATAACGSAERHPPPERSTDLISRSHRDNDRAGIEARWRLAKDAIRRGDDAALIANVTRESARLVRDLSAAATQTPPADHLMPVDKMFDEQTAPHALDSPDQITSVVWSLNFAVATVRDRDGHIGTVRFVKEGLWSRHWKLDLVTAFAR